MTNNQLFYGDNLEVLRKHISDNSIDLCYIDPPFNSKRNYNQIYNNVGKEDTAQVQAFIDTWTWDVAANKGFDEIINNTNGVYPEQSVQLILGLEKIIKKGALLSYLVSMTQRIAEIYRVLKPTGSFYLHCDPTASHYLKLVCDALFCSRGGLYQNEIVWIYKERELSKKHWNKKHDVIFFYTKSNKHTFNYKEVVEKYSDYTLKHKFKYQDEKGLYRLRYKDGRNDPKQENDETYRQYAAEGVLPRDWFDIPILNQASKERLGYPTQKPEALLERIIKASSNENDVILDAYCGCGTTIAVAERLNRRWVGMDITYQSIALILKRLEDTFGDDFTKDVVDKNTKTILKPAKVKLLGIPQDFDSAVALANRQDDRLRKEFEKWFVLSFSNNRAIINDKKGSDGGIDGTAFIVDYDDNQKQTFKQIIFSVKSNKTLSPSVIRDLYGTVEREKAAVGYLLTLYPMPNLVKEAAKYGTYQNKMFGHIHPRIEVVNVQELFNGKRLTFPTSIEVLKKAERKSQNDKELFI
jgi:DNA modification methylase